MKLKNLVIQKLNDLLDEKLGVTQKSIAEVIESRDGETKSSMGDKYETGRAMAELELNKLRQQMAQSQKFKGAISQINTNVALKRVDFGALVETNCGKYFMSVAYGSINIQGEKIFCISLASPIGLALREKRHGETLNFQGREIKIIRIE